MQALTLKRARLILKYARALPILKARDRHACARAARKIVAEGWTIPNLEAQREGALTVSYARVGAALARLAVADMAVVA